MVIAGGDGIGELALDALSQLVSCACRRCLLPDRISNGDVTICQNGRELHGLRILRQGTFGVVARC